MTKPWMWIGPLVALIGCSSEDKGSGVPGDKRLSTLSASEQADVCGYLEVLMDGPRTVQCGNGSSVEISDFAGCSLAGVQATCEATVADLEHCFRILSDDPCPFHFEECAPVFDCSFEIVPGAGMTRRPG